MMRLLFWIVLAACGVTGPVRAENARSIVVFDVTISVPVPDGYVDVSEENELPPENALFSTKAIEPWGKAGEINEGILFYGIGLKPAAEAIKQQKFEEIVQFTRERIEAQIKGKSFKMPEALISLELVNSIYRVSHGNNARAIEVTDDRKDRKAILIDTDFVMPGVTTYPIVEEISFTRVLNRIVIFHSIRVDSGILGNARRADIDIRANLKATGMEVRDGLIKAQP